MSPMAGTSRPTNDGTGELTGFAPDHSVDLNDVAHHD